ncbi:MAG: hypothetical protein DRZ90_05505, partial [Spirochaetes bacterium]
RTRCTITDITCEKNGVEVFSAEDLSVDGMLLRLNGKISSGELLNLSMKLPENTRRISFSGRVAYLVENNLKTSYSAGIAIEEIKETDRNRLKNFIVDIASGAAMLEYHKLLEREKPSEEFRIEGEEPERILRNLLNEGLTINHLDEEGLRIIETHISDIHGREFSSQVPKHHSGNAFFSFTQKGASFTFSTKSSGWADGMGTFKFPSVIFRGEKRAGQRKDDGGYIELTSSTEKVFGRMMDSSRRGILCEIPRESFLGNPLNTGQSLDISINGKTIPGEIRHIVEERSNEGRSVFRIGLETGIRRREPESTVYNTETWRKMWNGPQKTLGDSSLVHPRSIYYTNHEGRKIAALLHIIDPDKPCIAVVIPPAFGKKKEVLAPLALTLMANFSAAGENLAVLRYDGIDRPGESANANINSRRGYEMIGYRIDQGYTDLEATMHWIKNNDIFNADKTVLISFSMSALDARRLQAASKAPQADYWISVMGISSAQGALRNILGGLDVIASHRMGLPIGTMGMLGQLIDMDQMAADMTRLGYATSADARETMSKIKSPVTWLFGAYDKWIIPDEINDIMSIKSPGEREIIKIPTAHNLRTSNDAIKTFQMLSDAILRRLRRKELPSVSPDRTELLDLLTRERERVMENEELNARRYWKGYLIGESEEEEGYDFYRKLTDFKEFLDDEVSLLNPEPGESIADLGCGTGLVSEAILSSLAVNGTDLRGTRFTAVDLIDEALVKAEKKYQKLCTSYPELKVVKDSWISMDLEPDALAGLRNIVKQPEDIPAVITDLRERIKGLQSETIHRLESIPKTMMSDILKGNRIGIEMQKELDSNTSAGDSLVLTDLNRAARFILGDIDEEDLKPSRRRGSGRLSSNRLVQVRSSDLLLAAMNLGDWSREGKPSLDDSSFDVICGSLFLSYLFVPGEAVKEFFRMLKPDGRLLISTMKPDSDISGIFTRYIQEQSSMDTGSDLKERKEDNLREARSMLNEAAALFTLEEDGWFRFFDEHELITMMRNAGFTNIRVTESLGKPAQALIITGRKKKV